MSNDRRHDGRIDHLSDEIKTMQDAMSDLRDQIATSKVGGYLILSGMSLTADEDNESISLRVHETFRSMSGDTNLRLGVERMGGSAGIKVQVHFDADMQRLLKCNGVLRTNGMRIKQFLAPWQLQQKAALMREARHLYNTYSISVRWMVTNQGVAFKYQLDGRSHTKSYHDIQRGSGQAGRTSRPTNDAPSRQHDDRLGQRPALSHQPPDPLRQPPAQQPLDRPQQKGYQNKKQGQLSQPQHQTQRQGTHRGAAPPSPAPSHAITRQSLSVHPGDAEFAARLQAHEVRYAQSYAAAAGEAAGHDSGWHAVRQRGCRSSAPSAAGSDSSVDKLPLFNDSNPTAAPYVLSEPGTSTQPGKRGKRSPTKAKAMARPKAKPKASKLKSLGVPGRVLEDAEKSLGLHRPSKQQTNKGRQPQTPSLQQPVALTTAAPKTAAPIAAPRAAAPTAAALTTASTATVPRGGPVSESIATRQSVLIGSGQPPKAIWTVTPHDGGPSRPPNENELENLSVRRDDREYDSCVHPEQAATAINVTAHEKIRLVQTRGVTAMRPTTTTPTTTASEATREETADLITLTPQRPALPSRAGPRLAQSPPHKRKPPPTPPPTPPPAPPPPQPPAPPPRPPTARRLALNFGNNALTSATPPSTPRPLAQA